MVGVGDEDGVRAEVAEVDAPVEGVDVGVGSGVSVVDAVLLRVCVHDAVTLGVCVDDVVTLGVCVDDAVTLGVCNGVLEDVGVNEVVTLRVGEHDDVMLRVGDVDGEVPNELVRVRDCVLDVETVALGVHDRDADKDFEAVCVDENAAGPPPATKPVVPKRSLTFAMRPLTFKTRITLFSVSATKRVSSPLDVMPKGRKKRAPVPRPLAYPP